MIDLAETPKLEIMATETNVAEKVAGDGGVVTDGISAESVITFGRRR
jgi:hypothetical protein